MIGGAIFDVDGVLLDSLAIWDTLGERYLRQRGITAAPTLREELSSLSMAEGAMWMKTQYALQESVKDILNELDMIMRDFYLHQVKARTHVADIARELHQRQFKLGIATSGSLDLAQAALKRLGLDTWFAALMSCEEVNAGKQHPDVYRACARKLALDASELLVFEDAPFALRTALSAGFHGIGVSEAHHDQKTLRQLSEIYIDEQMSADAFIRALHERKLI